MILKFGHMMGPGSSSPPTPPPPPPATSLFQPILYTGNGTSQSIVTGLDFDAGEGLLWIKARDAVASPKLFDTLRGVGTYVQSTAGAGATSDATSVTAFTSTGFTVGASAAANSNAVNYVVWTFLEYAGFLDIVSYVGTGANGTVSHNLGVPPEIMFFKNRSALANWNVYTAATGAATTLNLASTSAPAAGPTAWNSTAPSSSVFSVGTSASTNSNGASYIAYLFATLPGVSKCGSYTGTAAQVDVDCGFAASARFIFIRRTDSTGDWYMWDSARGIVSGDDPYLLANSTAAEVTNTDYIAPFATGFSVTAAAPAGLNASGGTYAFMAIA